MCCSKSFRATLICDVLPELSTRKVTWYFKPCRHYNTGSTVRPHLYDTCLRSSWSAFFLIKKREKRTFLFPSSVLHTIFIEAPPKETLPQSSTHSISFKYWGSEYWHFVDNYSNSPPVRQFSWVWDWDVLVWPVNPDWNYKLSNKMLQFAFTAVSYSLLW